MVSGDWKEKKKHFVGDGVGNYHTISFPNFTIFVFPSSLLKQWVLNKMVDWHLEIGNLGKESSSLAK